MMGLVGVALDIMEDPQKFWQETLNPNDIAYDFKKKVRRIEERNKEMNKGKSFKAENAERARLISRASFMQQNKVAMAMEVAEEMRAKQKEMEEREIMEEVERMKKMA